MTFAVATAQERPRSVEEVDTSWPMEERIRARAHELWLEHGQPAGSELEDWLQAEEEILRDAIR